jgi:hypothetical protein
VWTTRTSSWKPYRIMTETITFAEVVAYNHKVMSRGSFFEQLHELAVARSSSLSRQLLEGVVEELENVGLISAAADLMEFAQTLPHRWDLPNDYAHEIQHKERMARERADWEAKHSAQLTENTPTSS